MRSIMIPTRLEQDLKLIFMRTQSMFVQVLEHEVSLFFIMFQSFLKNYMPILFLILILTNSSVNLIDSLSTKCSRGLYQSFMSLVTMRILYSSSVQTFL